ncbi:class I SAM-dependent methyltransferase [Methanococcoides sp. SA1]|nr:class I SAM-dependent methyltransferase [Methanococcoides sp. SA1]
MTIKMTSKLPINNDCICGSTNFHDIVKYSYSMEKNVEFQQCILCRSVRATESKEYDLAKIYNDDYFNDVDTGWKDRSKLLMKFINVLNVFLNFKSMKICDYGAGNGYLTKSLLNSGYNVLAYEPYMGKKLYIDRKYYKNEPFEADVLLMVEVFEHFTDALNEIKEILVNFNYPRFIIFTTLLVENAGENIIDWWYLDPDAGHFTLWSKKSLETVGNLEGYKLISFTDSHHILCKKEQNKEYIILKLESLAYDLYKRLKYKIQNE